MKIRPHYLPVMPDIILNDLDGFFECSKVVFGATPLMIQKGEKQNHNAWRNQNWKCRHHLCASDIKLGKQISRNDSLC